MRLRRLRMNEPLRRLVRETFLSVCHLVQPVFVVEGEKQRQPIVSMPGIERLSLDELEGEVRQLAELGLGGVILFGIPQHKDEQATSAYAPGGIVQRAIAHVKKAAPELVVITDVCLCEYTSHGHCGIVRDGVVLNDESVEVLCRVALSHAAAGADIVAPSDMMDGRVAAIRAALDTNGYSHVPILSYSSKFASAFYGPFREAAHSTPAFGDRRSHQLDPANFREAIRESLVDVAEGADMLMVKPALPYLDVLHELRQRCDLPLAAYQVSGEYAMLKAAGANGWLDERRAVEESLTAIRRAGADVIITYFAKDFAKWQRNKT
ncbi:MAG: porphobilinogen synthase [Candidatus Sumerlaeaceae bacterium]|nr:porphobilinogen synthase [Candidatus Sumerlaeaceae bacterium]